MTNEILHENGLTIIRLFGSITSGNAGELEAAVASEPDGTDGIIFDAAELAFISSAGLRVLLSAKKRCKDKVFRIIHVNDDVMNVFDVTGFSEIMEIERAARSVSIEGCSKIGAGACGEVYRLDDETIIKLYYPHVSKETIELEKSLAKKAFVMGVPTAISYDIVDCDGRTGVVYELIKSKTIGELIREDESRLEEYVAMYADVCRQIHSITAEPGILPTFKDLNREDIPKVVEITDEERQLLYDFLDMLPDPMNCLHGDLNINNIMVQNGECCLIDMGEFSTGTPMFDISRIIFSMEFATPDEEEYNSFYKMPQSTVTRILRLFLRDYFGCDTLEEAAAKNPEVEWLYPLAWFRCCTSMLKGDRWPEKRAMVHSLLREKLIPFIREHKS